MALDPLTNKKKVGILLKRKYQDKFITNEMLDVNYFLNSNLSLILHNWKNKTNYRENVKISQLIQKCPIRQNFYDFYAKSFSFTSSKERISKFSTNFSYIKSVLQMTLLKMAPKISVNLSNCKHQCSILALV